MIRMHVRILKQIFANGIWRALATTVLATTAFAGSHATGSARPPTPPGWFHVYRLDAHTYALSEPKYWQENVSYLLIGTRRALLFDTGPGIYSIRAQVRRLTQLPVIAIPSHLHFDHVGDLEEFSDVRLLDTPGLRSQMHGGYFVEGRTQYMLRTPFKYPVHGWIEDGQNIDLGGRTVRVVATPGHTPDSLSVIDQGRMRLFTGDLVNRVVSLYAVPGADVAAAARSLQHLQTLTPAGSLAYEAHAEAPLSWAELQQLAAGTADIAAGRLTTSTVVCLGPTPMRRFTVGPFPILLPGPRGTVQDPLGSVTETVDFGGNACK
jgi:glyoxylase-like metal-dependent hydrolase (beta-lactamase superfamily II)